MLGTEVIFATDKVCLFRPQPKPDPLVAAVVAISNAAQTFAFVKARKEMLRAETWFPGVTEEPKPPHHWELEAFGATRAECEDAVARYLAAFPWKHWHTQFEGVRETALGFVAYGTRWQIKDWF